MSLLSPNAEKNELQAKSVWIDEERIHVELIDGRIVSTPLLFYPSIYDASREDRDNFYIFGEGTAIHWKKLDIDLPVEAIIEGEKEYPFPVK